MVTKKCPWTGLICDCAGFPWLINNAVPAKCEAEMPIEMAAVRKVSLSFKGRYLAYLVPCRRCKFRYEKTEGVKHGLCEKCAGIENVSLTDRERPS